MAGCIPAMPVTSSPMASWSCWAALSEVVHTAKGERYIPNYIENRLKFSPYVKDVAVLGKGRDTLGRHRLHRQGAGRALGRDAGHLVHVVCRPVAEARGDRTGRQAVQRVNGTCPSR
jgi:hypothetical protein